MATLNPFDVQSRHIVEDSGTAETLYAGCGDRGGNSMCYSIGNGQVMQTGLHKTALTLNCMHDQQIVLVRKGTK